MTLLIDGYNLLYAAGILRPGRGPGTLEKARLALLNVLAESLDAAEAPRTTVVFDARHPPPDLPATMHHRGMTVQFAPREGEADDLIEELIRTHSAPRRLTVVSSDRRLKTAARRRKAQAADSETWFERLLAARRQRRQSAEAAALSTGPLSEDEVEFWLHEFEQLEGLEDLLPDDDLPMD